MTQGDFDISSWSKDELIETIDELTSIIEHLNARYEQRLNLEKKLKKHQPKSGKEICVLCSYTVDIKKQPKHIIGLNKRCEKCKETTWHPYDVDEEKIECEKCRSSVSTFSNFCEKCEKLTLYCIDK